MAYLPKDGVPSMHNAVDNGLPNLRETRLIYVVVTRGALSVSSQVLAVLAYAEQSGRIPVIPIVPDTLGSSLYPFRPRISTSVFSEVRFYERKHKLKFGDDFTMERLERIVAAFTKGFELRRRPGGDKAFPVAHTCFNRLDLPAYSDVAVLARILSAILEGDVLGFSGD